MSEVIWGINPVLEALKSQPEKIEEIWLSGKELKGRRYRILELARALEIPVKVVRSFHPPKVPPEARTQGVVAYLRGFDYTSLEEFESQLEGLQSPPLVVLLDELTDPQNVGSLIRTAEALGATGLFLPKHRSAGVTPAVIKASAGAVFHLPIVRVVNLRQAIRKLKERGLFVFGLSPGRQSLLFELDLTGPVALVIGSEGQGLREGVKKECDFLVRIPMSGHIESLNAAVAGAIAIYEVLRQRSV